MATFSRIDIVLKIRTTGIVPVFYDPDTEVCKNILSACYAGGIRVFEFTNRGDFAHEVFAELNKFRLSSHPDLALGTGSVPDAATAALYIQTGSDFIVSPFLHPDIARTCNRRKILWIPGCGTATEISQAEELGAEIVKIFPGGTVGGPEFIRNIRGPMPWSSLMPTGGISPDEEDLKAWFDAGAIAVGIGSRLITKEIITRKNYHTLEEKIKSVMETVGKLRAEGQEDQ